MEDRTDEQEKDYDKLIDPRTASKTPGSDRDLGTVGGGPIPGAGAPREGMNTSSGTNSSADTVVGAGQASDRGSSPSSSLNDPGIETERSSSETISGTSGTVGGRSPGQPQTAGGDQDATRGNRNSPEQEIADPMTARTPDKVKKQD